MPDKCSCLTVTLSEVTGTFHTENRCSARLHLLQAFLLEVLELESEPGALVEKLSLSLTAVALLAIDLDVGCWKQSGSVTREEMSNLLLTGARPHGPT